jgi:hypothetical protein
MKTSLNVSERPEQSRMGLAATLAARVEVFVKAKFTAADGYGCKLKTSQPFQEWPKLLGHHVVIVKGLLGGFEVRVAPADFQVREIHASLVPQSRLNEMTIIVSLVVGALAGLVAAIVTYQESTSDTGRSVIIAFFTGFFGVGGMLFVISRLLLKVFIKFFTDPAKAELEREALWQELLPVLNEELLS